jgi:sugar phosphate isomerase/epimerase
MNNTISQPITVTRTGSFPIGFRRGGGEWQKDLPTLLAWASEHGFGAIDLGRDGDQTAATVTKAGLKIGSVDLVEWAGMISPDAAVRQKALAQNTAYIEACAAAGAMNHFVVMLPEKPELPRAENFGYMVESFRRLAPVLEANQARIVIEGWPGPGALCCTPEGYGAFFRDCPSPAMGVNYDPSHLVRMGIDPLRFLKEFVDRVYHVHGKDTVLLPEDLYLYGNAQEATFAEKHGWGGMHWRYTIPGHGCSPWGEITRTLADHGYKGVISIELEDVDFCLTPEGEKAGLLHSRNFLQGC